MQTTIERAPAVRIADLKREALSGKVTGLFNSPLVLDGEFSRRAYLARSVGQHADAEADRVARVAA